MSKKSGKSALVLLVLAVGLVAAGVVAKENKYYIKKFVRSNKHLYTVGRAAVRVKARLAALLPLGRTAPELRQPVFRRDVWSVQVDASQRVGECSKFWTGIGFESLKAGVLSRRGRMLLELIQESNRTAPGSFQYVRAHNLFSDGQPPYGEGLGIYREDEQGEPIYDWEKLNTVFDRIVGAGLRAVVELGFMPDALASIPDRRQKWGRGNISPPKDYNKWRNLVYETIRHLQQRYGDEELEKWYFEVWNEPDLGYLFWVEDPENSPWGDMKEYARLYASAVDAVKAVNPRLRVGGPASAGAWIDKFLETALLESKPPVAVDFVSTHVYGEVGYDYRQGRERTILGRIHWKLGAAFDHDHKAIRRAMSEMPFLLTEVGPSTRANPGYNTAYYAAWLVKMVDGIHYLADVLGERYVPQLTVLWTTNPVVRRFKEEGGIATAIRVGRNSEIVLKRPVYNAFEALGYLGRERLKVEGDSQFGDLVHAIAASNSDQSVQVLIYSLRESTGDEENEARSTVRVTIENLPFESFSLRLYQIDSRHGNVHTAWRELGEPRNLSPQQARELDKRDDLVPVAPPRVLRAEDRRFYREFQLETNAVLLLVLQVEGHRRSERLSASP